MKKTIGMLIAAALTLLTLSLTPVYADEPVPDSPDTVTETPSEGIRGTDSGSDTIEGKWYIWEPSTGTLTLREQLPDTGFDNSFAEQIGITDPDDIKKIAILPKTKAGSSLEYAFSPYDGENLIWGLKQLTSIVDLSNLDTSNVTSMLSMFDGCSSLISLDMSGFDTSKVTLMYHMFSECRSLTSLDLSGWNTSGVTDMSDMFCMCSSLTSLNLSGWDMSKVTNMHAMFYWCKSLTSLDLSGWNTSNATNMSQMFDLCSSLSSLNLSGWDTSNVENMDNMFSRCPSLASLDLSGWDTSKVNNMSYMFYECLSLTSLKLPEGFCVTYTRLSNISSDYIGWAKVGTTEIISGTSEYAFFTADETTTYYRVPRPSHTPAKEATCTEAGNIEYYEGADGKLYTDEDFTPLTDLNNDGTVDINDTIIPAAHAYSEPSWYWARTTDGYKAELTSVCTRCGDTTVTKGTITSVTDTGKITYTATAEIDGETLTSSLTVNESYTFTVNGGTITAGEKDSYSFGDAVTVKAPQTRTAPDASQVDYFSGWYIGDDLITTKLSYTFYVKSDMTVTAKYDRQAPITDPKVDLAIRINREDIADTKQKVTITVNWALPKGYKLKEAGLVRKYDDATGLTYDNRKGEGVKNNKSTSKKANGTYTYIFNVSATTKLKTINAVAYAVYTDKSGNKLVAHTEIKASAYSG